MAVLDIGTSCKLAPARAAMATQRRSEYAERGLDIGTSCKLAPARVFLSHNGGMIRNYITNIVFNFYY